MSQQKIMKVLEDNPFKYYSAAKLSKILNINVNGITVSVSKLIKYRLVQQKFIYNERKNKLLRLIKIKDGQN